MFSGSREWSVRLDEIDHRYSIRKSGVMANGCLSVILIVVVSTLLIIRMDLVMIVVAVLVIFILIVVGRFTGHSHYIELQTKRGSIIIPRDAADAEEFVKAVIKASRQYLIWKYGTVDRHLNREKQIENFWWLRNNGIITDEEYKGLTDKLNEILGNVT